MNLLTTKLELIKKIADIQSKKLLEQLEAFLNQSLIEEREASRSSTLTEKESSLIIKINEGLPEEIQLRYNELLQKSVAKSLTKSEYEDLLQIIPQIEAKNVERLQYLAELAKLWDTSIDIVMDRLGIQPPPVLHA